MKTIEVFVSSVIKEFETLRKKIKSESFHPFDDRLRVVMMGDKGGRANANGALDVSLENAADADIFILLLGETYGSVPKGHNKSYTHREYEKAIEHGLNILAFPIGDIYTNPDGIQYSQNQYFRQWQENVLFNSNTHISETPFPSDSSIDTIYKHINEAVHNHILDISTKRGEFNVNKKIVQSELTRQKKEHCIIFIHDSFPRKTPFRNAEGKLFDTYLLNSHKDFFDFDYTFRYCKTYSFLKINKYLLYLRYVPIIKHYIDFSSYFSIQNLSKSLLTKYTNRLKEGYKTVSFIGDGMGGIIAKKTIIDLCKEDKVFKGFYISLASPHANLEKIIKNTSQTLLIKRNTDLINKLNKDWKHYKKNIIRKYYCDQNDQIMIPEIVFPDDQEEHKGLIQTQKDESISKPCRNTSDIINDLNIFIKNSIQRLPSFKQ